MGEGTLDFESIVAEIKKSKIIEWVAVEQDNVPWGTPKENMELSRKNLN